MKLPCFNLNHSAGENQKMLYKNDYRPTKVTEMLGVGDVADWVNKRGGTEEMPEWAKEDRTKVELRTDVETKKSLGELPRPVTPRAKDTLRIRTQKEIFGTKEIQEWYINRLREALEIMDGDRLHDFIMAHKGYGKNRDTAWNRDFASLIGLKPQREYWGGSEGMKNRRITAAAQHVLVDFYNTDVFQLTLTKTKINPWIFIDGRMGPYTVSVLADYWTAKYGRTSTKTPNPPGNAGLNNSYKKDGANIRLFGAALAWFAVQKGTATRDEVRPQREASSERNYIDRVKQKYAELDRAGDEIKLKDLTVKNHGFDLDMDFSQALGIVYREKLAPTHSGEAKKAYRLLNLLAQKIGPEVDRIKIRWGDTLNVTPRGLFTIKKSDGSSRYKIQLSN